MTAEMSGEKIPDEKNPGRQPMDPFARKMIFGAFLYGAMMLAMFAVLSVVYLHTHPRCAERVVAESLSPDKQWAAMLMERRCGEDTPFFAHVNLRPAAENLEPGFFTGSVTQGETFLLEQDVAGAGITLAWTAPNRLTILCPRCNASLIRKRDEQWAGVALHYE